MLRMLASALAPRAATASLVAARASVASSQSVMLPRVAVLSTSAAAAGGHGTMFRAAGAASALRAANGGAPWASARAISNTALMASKALPDLIQKEIDYETENYEAPELKGAPAGWELKDTSEDTHMILTKSYGEEKVQIDVMVNDQPDAEPNLDDEVEEGHEDEEDLDVDIGVVFNVSITKGSKSLVFECRSDGAYLDILHCSLEPADEEVDDAAYTGPVYEELDEELQASFRDYLEERGVDTALGGHILSLVHDKEQREYMAWLSRVKDFVK